MTVLFLQGDSILQQKKESTAESELKELFRKHQAGEPIATQ